MAMGTAQATVRKVEGGMKVEAASRSFTIIADEPVESGGTDAGMNPVEMELCSLGSCLTIAAHYLAPAKGVEIESFSVELEGDIDPDGFMGLNPDVRCGFSEIRVTPHIKCNLPDDEARAFVEFVKSRCPVSDNLSNGVPVSLASVVVE